MYKKQIVSSLAFALVGGMAMLAGCATQGGSSKEVTSESVAKVQPAMEPTAPVAAVAAPEPVAAPVAKAEAEAPADTVKPGTVSSVLKKMDENRLTLFWREKGTYTFSVGGLVDAEYKPGDGLFVRDDSASDKAVECNYSEDGKFKSDPALSKTCSELMFTLDQELDE